MNTKLYNNFMNIHINML